MNPLLDTVEPDGWRNPASTNADYAFDFIRSASYCDPLYSRPKVESLLSQCRKEARKEALLEAAEKLDAAFGGNAGIMFRSMAEGGG